MYALKQSDLMRILRNFPAIRVEMITRALEKLRFYKGLLSANSTAKLAAQHFLSPSPTQEGREESGLGGPLEN